MGDRKKKKGSDAAKANASKAQQAALRASKKTSSMTADAIYFVFLVFFFWVMYKLARDTTGLPGNAAPPFSVQPSKEVDPLFGYLGPYAFEEGFDALATAAWAKDTMVLPIVCSVIYMCFLINGREFMKDKTGFVPKLVIFFWNALLAVFSIFGAWRMIPFVWGHLKGVGWRDGMHILVCAESPPRCEVHGYICLWLFLFCYSKLPEMIDTVLMVFDKKPVVFLHWFHHVTVMWFCVISWYNLSPAGVIYGSMNFTVHACMYTWYAMSAIKLKPKGFSILLTLMQVWQMIAGCGVAAMTFYWQTNCDNHWSVRWYGIIMYGCYLFLFLKFFVNKYCFSRPCAPIRKKTWDKADSGFVVAKE